jgi:hypothetical protein
MFDILQKSSNFLAEIMTLVSSANIMGFAKVFFVGGRSLMYITKSKQGVSMQHLFSVSF